MTILYINEEHCTCVQQLRRYFENSQRYDSPIFCDLLDYARSGDISSWLRAKGELLLADKIDDLDIKLGDSEYYSRLSALMNGSSAVHGGGALEKPDFSKCFHIEDVNHKKTAEGMVIYVHLKILSLVNESYKICVSSSWGKVEKEINSFHKNKDELVKLSFSFPRRHEVLFKDVVLLADGRELHDAHWGGELEIEYDSCRFRMIRVEHGTFMMGVKNENGNNRNREMPEHKVILTKDYYIGEIQVTQALWESIMGSNPSYFKGANRPVECVSWDECQTFIKQLSLKTGRPFRLPTEAEWEFAAKGGNWSRHTPYSGSDDIDDVAWYNGNSNGETCFTKTKKSNELGIYDMSGNVWEWCQDRYGDYKDSDQTDPMGPKEGQYRVNRGGSWADKASNCRSSHRAFSLPSFKNNGLGLRLVISVSKD